MHLFLQGMRNIGKSTVILRTLEILCARKPLVLGGFFTWNGGEGDPHVYMKPAWASREGEIYRIAGYDEFKGGMVNNVHVFEQQGACLLSELEGADLIIMDELGFFEENAPIFKQAVLETLAGNIPVLGVLRLGDVPWHADIKSNPKVMLIDVNEKNRDALPQEMAFRLQQ